MIDPYEEKVKTRGLGTLCVHLCLIAGLGLFLATHWTEHNTYPNLQDCCKQPLDTIEGTHFVNSHHYSINHIDVKPSKELYALLIF